MRELTLQVTGMNCGACVASVEKAVSSLDVVASVAVNLPLEKARIVLTQAADTNAREQCIAAIISAGFKATDLTPAPQLREQNKTALHAKS